MAGRRRPWWKQWGGVPGALRASLLGDGRPLPRRRVRAVRSELASLAALAVLTGVFTHPGLIIIPLTTAVFESFRLAPDQLRQVAGMGRAGGGHPETG